MNRSDAEGGGRALAGADVLRGDLDDLDGLRRGADDADAVVHLANKHDWADMPATSAAERAAVRALGDAMAGSGRPFVVAAGVAPRISARRINLDSCSGAVSFSMRLSWAWVRPSQFAINSWVSWRPGRDIPPQCLSCR